MRNAIVVKFFTLFISCLAKNPNKFVGPFAIGDRPKIIEFILFLNRVRLQFLCLILTAGFRDFQPL